MKENFTLPRNNYAKGIDVRCRLVKNEERRTDPALTRRRHGISSSMHFRKLGAQILVIPCLVF